MAGPHRHVGTSAGRIWPEARRACIDGSAWTDRTTWKDRTAMAGNAAETAAAARAVYDLASGCPLADVLSRFASQLEVEDDAEAARQTALAGPKATVSPLTWLPLMGLGLGIALGVDPLAILFGTPLGLAALAAGVLLTVAGRVWSSRLVHAAAGAAVP